MGRSELKKKVIWILVCVRNCCYNKKNACRANSISYLSIVGPTKKPSITEYSNFLPISQKDIVTKMETPQRPSGIPISKTTPKLRFNKTFSKSNDGNLNGNTFDSMELDTFTLLEENSALKDEKQNLIDKLTEGTQRLEIFHSSMCNAFSTIFY